MSDPKPELFRAAAAEVGEGPAWDAASSTLVWVDILACRVWFESLQDPAAARFIRVPSHVGAAMPSAAPGELLVLLRDGFYTLGANGSLQALARPLADLPQLRFNDGKVDPRGRAFGGSTPYTIGPTEAALYRLDPVGSERYVAHPCVPELQLSNGIGWSPDGRRMYLIDSEPGIVWKFDYNADTGAMSSREVFVQISRERGVMPDGLTVDDDACVWLALWGGSAVHRYTPGGQLDRVIRLPVSQPTSMCFAGPDLSTLVITTASYGLNKAALTREPLAGSLFTLDAGCTGPAATPWRSDV